MTHPFTRTLATTTGTHYTHPETRIHHLLGDLTHHTGTTARLTNNTTRTTHLETIIRICRHWYTLTHNPTTQQPHTTHDFNQEVTDIHALSNWLTQHMKEATLTQKAATLCNNVGHIASHYAHTTTPPDDTYIAQQIALTAAIACMWLTLITNEN